MMQQAQQRDTFKIWMTVAVAATAGLMVWAASQFSDFATWHTTRSAGIVAYGLLTLSTVWGLLTSSRILTRWVKPPTALELHKVFSFIGLVAVGVHGFVLLFDEAVTYSIWQILVPFMSSYRPVSVADGIIAGYLMVMLSFSFYVKRQIGGPKVWRMFHYTGFLAFALGTLHGILSGTDTGSAPMIAMYTASGAVVLFLTYVRILGGRYVPARRSAPAHAREEADRRTVNVV